MIFVFSPPPGDQEGTHVRDATVSLPTEFGDSFALEIEDGITAVRPRNAPEIAPTPHGCAVLPHSAAILANQCIALGTARGHGRRPGLRRRADIPVIRFDLPLQIPVDESVPAIAACDEQPR